MDIRIGNGYDTHPLVDGETLILGGVSIDHYKGTKGHSDGDVLIHAIMDSLLGAANLGDIGKYFPSNSIDYKNISSLVLLEKVNEMLHKQSYSILNIDSTIVLQKPMLKDYISLMKKQIDKILLIGIDRISIKATTNDKLGFIGEEKGISVISTALLKKDI
tara:strand:- start:924 stop:1406 length:483 start_codon:yes stop_codon:yes gene_type:complete